MRKTLAIILVLMLSIPLLTFIPSTADDIQSLDGNANTYGYIDDSEYPITEYYYENGSWYLINETIVPKTLTISGRTYEYGTDAGWYEAYFREQSSDVKDRPIAMVSDNYTLTFSPVDFVIFQPHKGTTNGRVGNRVQSDAVVSGSNVTYPGFYDKVGTSGSFANITFEYTPKFIKENFVMWDKAYLQDRFTNQCNQEDYAIVNLTFSEVVRVYDTSDQDNKTLGVVYGNQRTSFKQYGMHQDNDIITNETVYFIDANNETVYSVRKLYAYDSVGNSILLDKELSMTAFGNLEIKILVPYWWLNETATFPVYVDPTIYGEILPPAVDEFEWDIVEGANTGLNGACRVNNSEYWLIVAMGDGDDGWVRSIQVWNSNGSIRQNVVSSFEYDNTNGLYANIRHIPGTDKYVIAYRDTTSSVVKAITIQVWDNNGTINPSVIDTIQFPHNGQYVFLLPFTDNIYIVAYTDDPATDDAFMHTIWVNYSGTINDTILDTEEFDETFGYYPFLCQVDDDTIAISYVSGNTAGDYTLKTYNISGSGAITDTATDSWNYEANPYRYSCLNKVGDTVYEVTYVDSLDDIYTKTVTISNNGIITESWIDTLTVVVGGSINNLETFVVIDPLTASNDKGVLGVTAKAIAGSEYDGYMWTWNVTDTGSLDASYISQWEFDTSDSQYYAHVEWVSENYFLIVYTGSGMDGWAKTVYIETNWASPVASNPDPSNGETNVELQPLCSINVTDSNGDLLDVTFAENSTGSWVNRQTNSSVGNGTYRWTYTQATLNNKKYYWRVYVDDGGVHNVSYIYSFTTIAGAQPNNPPVFSNEKPTDDLANIDITQATVNVTIIDPDGNVFNWTIEGQYVNDNSDTNDTNGSKSATLATPLPYNTDIIWFVNASDGYNWTNATYNFTTRNQYQPIQPISFNAVTYNRTQINLAWTKQDDYTYIEWNSMESWSRGSGTFLYNNTGATCQHVNLDFNTQYFYQAWSYNETDNVYSSANSSDNDTTDANNPVSFGTPIPANNSINQSLSLIWSIPLSDLDGDLFNWTIECSNSQTNSSNDDTNGSKELIVSGLSFDTTYTIWVNVTDGYNWTRAWYIFTTLSVTNNLPVLSNEIPPNGTTNVNINPSYLVDWQVDIEDPEGDLMNITIECSETAQNANWELVGNGTYQLTNIGPLAYNTTYTILVEITENGTGRQIIPWYIFTTEENSKPVFSEQTTTNNSFGIDKDTSYVGVTISDLNGDLMDWSIQTSKGTWNQGTNVPNSTVFCFFTPPLVYGETITWWVNITDGTDWTREWYVFTIENNTMPVISNEQPINNSINISLNVVWNCTITDPDETMNWTIECNNTQNASGSSGNGSIQLSLSGLSILTTYTIWVNVTDSFDNVSEWFLFTTGNITNIPPEIPDNPSSPINHSDYESVYNVYLNVTVNDLDGGTIDVYYYWGNDTFIGTDLNVPVDTNASLFLPSVLTPDWLDHNTTYYWYVNITDGIETVTSPTWDFTTSKAWDCDENRFVNYLDVSIVVSNYGTSGYLPGEIPADIVENGIVNYLDISSLVSHYGESY